MQRWTGSRSVIRVVVVMVVVAAVVASCGAAASAASALDGTLKKIKETGTIVIGHREYAVPFSYYDDRQQVIGYSMDLCDKIVAAVKRELALDRLDVKLVPLTAAMRIPLLLNGTIDLECGSTGNTLERQKEVAFSITHFVTGNRFLSKTSSNLTSVEDLKGKTVISTSGSNNIRQITEINAQRDLGMTVLTAKDHPEAFLAVETGRAAAFVMDDILLAGLLANAKSPDDYRISPKALSVGPYAIMLRRDDPAFKKVVDDAMTAVYASGEINAIYDKWFMRPIPPRNITLNVPMSEPLKKVIAKPTDSGDPASY